MLDIRKTSRSSTRKAFVRGTQLHFRDEFVGLSLDDRTDPLDHLARCRDLVDDSPKLVRRPLVVDPRPSDKLDDDAGSSTITFPMSWCVSIFKIEGNVVLFLGSIVSEALWALGSKEAGKDGWCGDASRLTLITSFSEFTI
jgi:hypothetical protein